jgi:hypothetical protein
MKTAREAREEAARSNEETIDIFEAFEILEGLEQAVSKGVFTFTINREISEVAIKALEEMGYTVRETGDQHVAGYSISWITAND